MPVNLNGTVLPGQPGYRLTNHNFLQNNSNDEPVTEIENEYEEDSEKHANVPLLSDLMGDYQDEIDEANTDFANQFKTDYEETIGRITENASNIEKSAQDKIIELYTSKNIFTRDTDFSTDEFSIEEKNKLKYFQNILQNIEMYRTQEGLLTFLKEAKIVKEVASNLEFLKREYSKFKHFKRRNKLYNSLNFDSAINVIESNLSNVKFKHYNAFCYCLLRYLNFLEDKNELKSNLIYATFTSATTNASIYSPRPFYTTLFEKLDILESSSPVEYKKRLPTVNYPTTTNRKKKTTKRSNKKRNK